MLNCDKTEVIKKDHSGSTSASKFEYFCGKYGIRISNYKYRVDM